MNRTRSHLKILHLISQRPDSTGSGIYLQAMLTAAAERGHRNGLVAGIPSGPRPPLAGVEADLCRYVRFEVGDIPFCIVGMSDVMPYASRTFSSLTAKELSQYERVFAQALTAAAADFRPDLIHSHHLWIVTALARRHLPHIPVAATCHGSDLRQFQNCPHLAERVLAGCRRLHAVMALSAAQKQEIVRLYGLSPEKVHVVGAGTNDRLFSSGKKPAPVPVQVVYAGKLSRAKGVPWLLRALSKIPSPAWHLHLVGGGSGREKAECLKLAERLGAQVTVHGAVPQTDLARIMKTAHIFVLPSFYEGLPLVALEALACGCRLVVTDLPGVREILGDGRTDFIHRVPVPRLHHLDRPWAEDEDTFEENLRCGLQAQMTAACVRPQIDLSAIRDRMARFSWQGVFEKVEKIYYRVVAPAPGRGGKQDGRQ